VPLAKRVVKSISLDPANNLTNQKYVGTICTYVLTQEVEKMPVKRLNIELPIEQYEFLQQEAGAKKTTISQLLRDLIDQRKRSSAKAAKRNYANDPFFQRKGSFDGPVDLAAKHDSYLYGQK
jgi:hypothetical protein